MKRASSILVSTRTPPKNLKQEDVLLFAHEYCKSLNQAQIKYLRCVDVLNHSIFNRYKLKFYQKFTHLYTVPCREKLKYLKLFLKPYKEIDKAVWIIDNYSLGYFHWLTDSLTRLILCENLMMDHIIILPEVYEKERFIRQSLELLNLKVEFFETSIRLHVKELLLPGHTAPMGNYNKQIINKLRNRFGKPDMTPSLKIYISRGRSARRKITNEHELIPLLIAYGYQIHFFEDYDFCQQVALMQKASRLIGLHGAGLTNMLFMPSKGKILELRNGRDAHNNCYFSLSSDLEHDYYYVLNKGDSDDTHTANVTIDLEKIKTVIEEMGG